jgi:hypothetical protein
MLGSNYMSFFTFESDLLVLMSESYCMSGSVGTQLLVEKSQVNLHSPEKATTRSGVA